VTTNLCRDDGRCQYAIDHGTEGLAVCPVGKCANQRTQPHEPPMEKFIPQSDKVTDWDKEKVVARLREAITRNHRAPVWMFEHTIKAAIDLLSKEAA